MTGEMFTFRDVDNAVRRTASGLCRLGVKRGDVVMCFAPNSHDFVFVLLAAMCNGAPIAAVNSSYTACESTEVVLLSGWHSIVTSAKEVMFASVLVILFVC